MKMTLTLSVKMNKIINEAIGNDEAKNKTDFIRKAVYVYSYLATRRKQDGYEIAGIKGDRVESLNALFDV